MASALAPAPSHACVVNHTRSVGFTTVRRTASQSNASPPMIGSCASASRTPAMTPPTSCGSHATNTKSARPRSLIMCGPRREAGTKARSSSFTTVPRPSSSSHCLKKPASVRAYWERASKITSTRLPKRCVPNLAAATACAWSLKHARNVPAPQSAGMLGSVAPITTNGLPAFVKEGTDASAGSVSVKPSPSVAVGAAVAQRLAARVLSLLVSRRWSVRRPAVTSSCSASAAPRPAGAPSGD